jgi:hypothetical protein
VNILIFLAYEPWDFWEFILFIQILLSQMPKSILCQCGYSCVYIGDCAMYDWIVWTTNHPICCAILEVVQNGMLLKRTFWNILVSIVGPHEGVRKVIMRLIMLLKKYAFFFNLEVMGFCLKSTYISSKEDLLS